MAGLPQGGGHQIASLVATLTVLAAALAMIAAGGGLKRPLTAPKSVVEMAPMHARQG